MFSTSVLLVMGYHATLVVHMLSVGFYLKVLLMRDFIFQSVLDGYNGTVMAYGQTGTGKTFTLGHLGDGDTSSRGIMVRAMEDVLADISPETDSVSVSYLQVRFK